MTPEAKNVIKKLTSGSLILVTGGVRNAVRELESDLQVCSDICKDYHKTCMELRMERATLEGENERMKAELVIWREAMDKIQQEVESVCR